MALRMTIELSLDDVLDEVALSQAISWLCKTARMETTVAVREAGEGPYFAAPTHEEIRTGKVPRRAGTPEVVNVKDLAADIEVTEVTETAEDIAAMAEYDGFEPNDAETDDIQAQYAEAAAQVEQATPAPKKRRGRRSNAAIKAELDAKLAAGNALSPTLTAAITLPTGSETTVVTDPAAVAAMGPVTGAAFVPGMTMPAFLTPPVAGAGFSGNGVTPTQPAMPPAHPAPAIQPDAIMTFDDFRAAIAEISKINVHHPYLYVRRPVWLDGTPKDRWSAYDVIPAELRARLIIEMRQTVNQAPAR